jgi:hypothetical protein
MVQVLDDLNGLLLHLLNIHARGPLCTHLQHTARAGRQQGSTEGTQASPPGSDVGTLVVGCGRVCLHVTYGMHHMSACKWQVSCMMPASQ